MNIEELAAAAAELAERLSAMATMTALPGEGEMRWHDHREESITLAGLLNIGVHLIRIPA